MGFGKYIYTLHFVDDYSGFYWVYFMRTKDEGLKGIKSWKFQVENQCRLPVQMVHCDWGKEFGGNNYEEWTNAVGVCARRSSPHTPQQNSKGERSGGIITAGARCAIIDSGAPEFLWPFAEEYMAHVNNLLPSKSNPDNESPYERMAKYLGLNSTPYIAHLRLWGCVVYIHKKPHKNVSNKVAPRAWKGQFLGFKDLYGHVVIVYVKELHRVFTARDVRYREVYENDSTTAEDVEYEAVFDGNTYPTAEDVAAKHRMATTKVEKGPTIPTVRV